MAQFIPKTASQLKNVPTGSIAATDVQTALNELDTEKQTSDATLTSLAALGTAADKIPYTTGVDTWAETAITAFGRSLIDDANAATGIATLGLDADLATLSLPASTTISAFGATLVDDADAATARATLSLGNVDNTSDATKNAAAVTLTNKRITARVQSVTDAATVTPDADANDAVDITAIAQAFTIANPSGTPTNFQKLIIRIKDNATARAITWGNGYVAGGVALPSTTVLSKITTIGLIYNTANSLNKWQCVAVSQEA